MDAPEALREFLSYVVANLIDHPEKATIAVGPGSNGAVSYRVQLAPEDVRHVIGKNGMTVSAIRSLLNVAAEKHGIKISLRVDPAKDATLEGEAAPVGDGQ
ncbi:MAG: KH domain-containing protein [Verrucomicrobiaceae bacterium]|nr:KH domain-containing protein [Verrucomicrobiaceae bacterium]